MIRFADTPENREELRKDRHGNYVEREINNQRREHKIESLRGCIRRPKQGHILSAE